MARIEPLRQPRPPEGELRHPRPVPARGTIRIGRPDVRADTPSHTPGTQKGEEVSRRSPEKGRPHKAREARSSTAVNPSLRGPIDPRMPHLPPA